MRRRAGLVRPVIDQVATLTECFSASLTGCPLAQCRAAGRLRRVRVFPRGAIVIKPTASCRRDRDSATLPRLLIQFFPAGYCNVRGGPSTSVTVAKRPSRSRTAYYRTISRVFDSASASSLAPKMNACARYDPGCSFPLSSDSFILAVNWPVGVVSSRGNGASCRRAAVVDQNALHCSGRADGTRRSSDSFCSLCFASSRMLARRRTWVR